jgi:hypothetical protein
MKPGRDLNESQRDHIVEHLMDLCCISCYARLCLSRFVSNSTYIAKLSTILIYITSLLTSWVLSSVVISAL